MDPLQYDSYSTYSDGSTPRTPSPGSSLSLDDTHYQHSPSFFKPAFEPDCMPPAFTRDESGFADTHHSIGAVAPEWAHTPAHGAGGPHSRGSLLQELYDHELPAGHGPPPHPQDVYGHHSAEPHYGGAEWSGLPHGAHHQQHHHPLAEHHQHSLPPLRAPQDSMVRRATFPYVRHDHEAVHYSHPPPPGYEHQNMMTPYGNRGDIVYGEPMPMHGSPGMLAADPSALHGEPYGHHHHMPSPHGGYAQLDDGSVKLEDGAVMVPSQTGFYRPPSSGGLPMPYLSPHTGLPIQHTDDAASKETQYLRRRCFNCHTTEPPSWRRSTLNPGKIVCNKCGLYERTHLRPRPLRFDELRAGNKARKQSKTSSPKQRVVKKEPREHADAISRRASVSSNASSLGGSSDWDEAVSVYSTGSGPPSGFNSPAQGTFSIPRDSASASPQLHSQDGGIRLPTGGLSDIASVPSQGACTLQPRKAATSPPTQYYTPAQYTGRASPAVGATDVYGRRNTLDNFSLPSSAEVNGARRHAEIDLPEATGWQSVAMGEGALGGKSGKPRSKVVSVA